MKLIRVYLCYDVIWSNQKLIYRFYDKIDVKRLENIILVYIIRKD